VSDRGGVVGDVADDVAVVAASPDERELRWRKVGDGHERDPRSGVERSVPLGDEGAADAGGDRLECLVSGHGDGSHRSGTPVPGVDGQPVVPQGSGFLGERDEGFVGDVGEAQLSLDRQRIKLRWGPRDQSLRVQSLVFNSVHEARAAYFERVDQLEARGYLDGTAG